MPQCSSRGVHALKMPILHRGSIAPDDHHLRPFTTYSSPTRLMLDSILVASELATAGSVMKKTERIFPSINGFSQRSFCSGVPYRARTSMLPVSGAEQLHASAASCPADPMISHSGAYSRLVRPGPSGYSFDRNKFHSPSSRAFAFNSSKTGGICQTRSADGHSGARQALRGDADTATERLFRADQESFQLG